MRRPQSSYCYTAKPNEPSQRPGPLTCHVGRRKISLSTQQNITPDLTACSKSRPATIKHLASQNAYKIRKVPCRQGRARTTWVVEASRRHQPKAGVGGVFLRGRVEPTQWAGLVSQAKGVFMKHICLHLEGRNQQTYARYLGFLVT